MDRVSFSPASAADVPQDFARALQAAPQAAALWAELTPISRRDFISWINGAKQTATRQRRIEVACSKLEAGQRRPCCYAVIPLELYRALDERPTAKARWKELSAMQRRDYAGWIDEAPSTKDRRQRVIEACGMIETGQASLGAGR